MAKNLQTNIMIGGKLLPSFNSTFSMANTKMMNFHNNVRQANTMTKLTGMSLITTFRAVSTASVAAGVGLAYLGKKGLNAASDLQEAQNLQDVTFGKNSRNIDVWAKTADKSYGLAELAAKNYVSTFGSVLKSAGLSDAMYSQMSKNLTGLAGDWASFRNITQENAFEKIFAGVASGETEPLRTLGINMTVANLEAFALSKGIKQSYASMNQATQMALRYAFVMDKSKDAIGDFKRTQDSFANQQRLIGTNFTNLTTNLANRLIPVATKGYIWLNKFMTSVNVDAIGNKVDWFASKLEAGFIAVQPVISWAINTGFPMLASGINDAYDKGLWMYNLIANNWPLIEPVIYGIAAATVAYKVATWGLVLAQRAGMIITVLSRAWVVAETAMMMLQNGARLATVAQWLFNVALAANPIGLVVIGIGLLVAGLVLLVKHWDWVRTKITEVWNAFTGFIKNIPDWGLIFTGPIAPILLLIKHFDKVKEGALGAINAIKGFFGFGDKGSTALSTDVGHNATGTSNWHGGLTWVGEQGPELVNLPGGSQVIPNNRSLQMAGGGPNITFAPVIRIDGGNGDIEGQARKGIEAAFPGFENIVDEYFGNRGRLAYG